MSPTLYESIGLRVAELRRAAGMTQAQVAGAVGTTPMVISSIERGAGVPSLARIAAIADALSVPIAELFTFERPLPGREPEGVVVRRFTALARRLSAKDAEVVLAVAEALAGRRTTTGQPKRSKTR